MTYTNRFITHLSTAALSVAIAHSANAQSIDYASMTELFGEPVTTSATGKPQRASDVPVTMEIITQDEIRRSGAVDLPEVLRQVNGVNVVQNSSQSYDVSIRGYNQAFSQRLLVLVNGRQVYLDHYGYTAWSTIPVQLEEIRQIEVVKGPNTALFGFNAVSGVINIVTFNPLYDDESSVGARVGTEEYYQGHALHTAKIGDNIGMRVSAGIRQSSSFDSGDNGIAGANNVFGDPKQKQANLDMMAQLTAQSQLRVEVSGSSSEQGDQAPTGNAFNSDYEVFSGKVSYQQDSDWGLTTANVYLNSSEIQYSTLAGTGTPTNNDVWITQLEHIKELGSDHTVRMQGEWRNNSMETGAPLMPENSEIWYDNYAVSGMWNWQMLDNLSWTNAARGDFLRLDYDNINNTSGGDDNTDAFSYNSGFVYQYDANNTFRLGTARGVEIPSLIEYVTFIQFSMNDLDPAIVTNYELAWDRKISMIENGLFRSAVFYQKTDDVKAISFTQNGRAAANIGDSESQGIELELAGTIDQRFSWGLGYIYQTVNDDLNNMQGSNLTISKDYEHSNPEHHVNLKLGYNEGPWEANTLIYYVSQLDKVATNANNNLFLYSVDDYVGVNARVGYDFGHGWIAALEGQQLQDDETTTNSTPDVERRAFLSLTKKF